MSRFLPLFPEQASTMAGSVDSLFFFLVAVSAFFSILIAAALVVLSVRYRAERPIDEPGEYVAEDHGSHLLLEIVWSVIPLGLCMIMFGWGINIFFALSRPPTNSIQMYAVGKQWMWKFQHPEGPREINTLHVPVGEPVRLSMASEDVIHSFYVPAFRVKQDVVPGRFTQLWFEATKVGRFHLFCAEYCGTQHSGMIGEVIVMEPGEYQAWLGGGPARSLAEAGQALFQERGCASCHTAESGGRGPTLVGLFGKTVMLKGGGSVVADETYIRESIFNPRAKTVDGYEPLMPVFQGQLGEEQVVELIAYLKSLGGEKNASAAPARSAKD